MHERERERERFYVCFTYVREKERKRGREREKWSESWKSERSVIHDRIIKNHVTKNSSSIETSFSPSLIRLTAIFAHLRCIVRYLVSEMRSKERSEKKKKKRNCTWHFVFDILLIYSKYHDTNPVNHEYRIHTRSVVIY